MSALRGVLLFLGAAAHALGPASAAAQSGAGTCTPACRTGFACVEGRCVSACNPPCLAGEVCTEERECVLRSELVDPSTVRHHGGFYARLGLGAGYLTGDITNYEVSGLFTAGQTTEPTEGSIAGFAQLGELMLGGTVADGLVLGGGAWGVNAFAPEYEGTGRNLTTHEVSDGSAGLELTSLSQLGVFLLYYPDATLGFHAMLAPTLSVAVVGDTRDIELDYDVDGAEGIGWGLVLGAGYDFWVGDQWSLGASARLQYVSVILGSTDPQSTFSAMVPGLLATATYH